MSLTHSRKNESGHPTCPVFTGWKLTLSHSSSLEVFPEFSTVLRNIQKEYLFLLTKVPFIILQHCWTHWPCIPRTWNGAYIPQVHIGWKIWLHNMMRQAHEYQRKIIICCCWHSSANRRLVHYFSVHALMHVTLSSLREVPKEYVHNPNSCWSICLRLSSLAFSLSWRSAML